MALQKISSKIMISLMAVGLIPMLFIAFTATYTGKQALKEQTFNQLEAVRDIKRQALTNYLQNSENQLINLATNQTIIESMDGFALNYLSFGGSEDGMDEGDSSEVDRQRLAVADYWQNQFDKKYQQQNSNSLNTSALVSQLNDQAVRLQYAFIANNQHPLGEKNKLDALDAGLYGYNKFHNTLHPWLNDYLSRFGFYDIFLVDKNGNVVYSVFKELDFATNLENGPWKDSGLAHAYQQAKNLEAGQTTYTDLSLYAPSYNAPAGFSATPVYKTQRNGKRARIGTLIFQMPLDKISDIMKQRNGLGETGETYLVGQDGLMRSDSYLHPETHNVIHAFRNPESNKILTESVQRALQGEVDEILIERDGKTFLSAFAPLNFAGLQWVLLAEIEDTEAMAAVTQLETLVYGIIAILVLLIAMLGKLLSATISRPILSLAQLMHDVKEEFRFNRRCDIQSKDEIGLAAQAFNELLNSTEAALQAVNQTMHQISEGHFEHRITAPLKGDLADLKSAVNASALSVQSTMDNLNLVMHAIQQGDFSMRLGDEVKGDFRTSVNQAMQTMETAVTEIGEVIHALSNGVLEQRVTSQFQGDLDKLKTHTNKSLSRLETALDAIIEAVEAQSQGDLRVQIDLEMHGDLNRLKQALNGSSRSLDQVISQVVSTAYTVQHSSQEVSSGNHDLNQRTQAQAASLEETAAAMEELTSTIRNNTSNALNADHLAKEAITQTAKGQKIMHETEQAITEIHHSSKKIEEITGLIDAIAFQTNLLALNAAVEAARAGEHGRGFAVVAGEVRNLAGKSADAARDIKTLIENTVSSIEKGTEKILATSQSLQTINDSIIKVAERVAEISTASQEQQQGVTQINHAISDIDNRTQQNAALVEETTAAAESMAQQSQELQNAVAGFKVSATQRLVKK